MGPPPRVSVVVTTYNQALYIGSALESVFAQTRQPDEVIVVDDGSTDETPARIAPYRDRLVCIRQPNQGIAGARNTGIRRARGELLAFLDGDDVWEPEKLAIHIAAATGHPDSGLIVVNGVEFAETGLTRPSLFPMAITSLFDGGAQTVSVDASRYFLQGCMIATTSQVIIPAWVLETVGLSDPSLAVVSDWDLYLRIAERYPVTFVDRRLTRWRYHERSASGPESLRGLRWGEDSVIMFAKRVRETPGERRQLERTALRSHLFRTAQEAYYLADAGQRAVGLGALRRLLRWSWFSAAPAAFLLAAYSPAWLTGCLGGLARGVLKGRRPGNPGR